VLLAARAGRTGQAGQLLREKSAGLLRLNRAAALLSGEGAHACRIGLRPAKLSQQLVTAHLFKTLKHTHLFEGVSGEKPLAHRVHGRAFGPIR
jgi:hypothetical protein